MDKKHDESHPRINTDTDGDRARGECPRCGGEVIGGMCVVCGSIHGNPPATPSNPSRMRVGAGESAANVIGGSASIGCCGLVIAALIVLFTMPMPDGSMNPLASILIGLAITLGIIAYITYHMEKYLRRERLYRRRY